jgi:hypothetical protein
VETLWCEDHDNPSGRKSHTEEPLNRKFVEEHIKIESNMSDLLAIGIKQKNRSIAFLAASNLLRRAGNLETE